MLASLFKAIKIPINLIVKNTPKTLSKNHSIKDVFMQICLL